MSDPEIPHQWGSFALVSYIPDPLGSLLHGLRQSLPGEDNPQPHITILPPRPLQLPVEAASQMALKILLTFPAFEVELSNVRSFPDTNVLYLDVGRGSSSLYRLHAALNSGELHHLEEFDFRPHITLAGPVARADLKAVRQQAEKAWHSADPPNGFLLDQVSFLWLKPDSAQGEWMRFWSHRLSTKETSRARNTRAAVTSQTY